MDLALLPLLPLLTLAQAPKGNPAEPLATLRAGHPRLILTDVELDRVRTMIGDEPEAKQLYDGLRERAHKLLDAPPTEFRIVGPRLLSQSRQVLDRIYTLGLIYRLDGDEAVGRRAVAELAAAAAWPHWNPSHFLDTAELNHAFGIGWDWLQPVLGDQRDAIRTGFLDKGLKVAQETYHKGAWWEKVRHNWNQVCNGGNAIGALAIADEEPELAADIIRRAVAGLPLALHEYAPDGGWAEGPGYWHYATRYTCYVLAAMDTALGSDFGLSDSPGFSRAGDFRLYFVGPTGETFNYADAGAREGGAEEMFWLARRFDAPRYAWHQRRRLGHALDLIWYDPRGNDPDAEGVPLDAAFDGVDVAFLRGSWQDPNTTWVAFKGGNNRANHSHLDLGTFVLDALGERWIHELGGDNYNMPGYFGGQRWTYYRLKTLGQNTLLLDGANQRPNGTAPLLAFRNDPSRGYGVADLTSGYEGVDQARRGVALLDGRDVLLVDEVKATQPVEVLWGAHTRAEVECDGAKAILRQHGKALYARVLSPDGARFEARSAHQEPPQNPNDGVTRLTVVLPDKVTDLRLAVLFSPVDGATAEVGTLNDWIAAAKQ
jgi:hypothetical protein